MDGSGRTVCSGRCRTRTNVSARRRSRRLDGAHEPKEYLALTISAGGWLVGRVLRALVMVLAAAAAVPAAAQTEPALTWAGRSDVPGQYWVDASGKATLEAARAAFDGDQGRASDPAQIMPLGGGVAIWYRLQLPVVAAPALAVFTVPFGGMDNVELFRPDGAGGWRGQRAGESLPVSQWPLRYLHPAFAFTLQPRRSAADLPARPAQPPDRGELGALGRQQFRPIGHAVAPGAGRLCGVRGPGGRAQHLQRHLVARPHPSLLRRPGRPGRTGHHVAHRNRRRIPVAEQRVVERQGLGRAARREPGLDGPVPARAGGRARPPLAVLGAAGACRASAC